jgi:hypothetical protein
MNPMDGRRFASYLEQARAEAAEAEVARLKALLEDLENNNK